MIVSSDGLCLRDGTKVNQVQMRSLNDNLLEYAQSQHLVAFLVIVFFSITAYFFVPRDNNEQPVPFDVPIPEQSKPGWRGEILEYPSIKVHRRSTFLYQTR